MNISTIEKTNTDSSVERVKDFKQPVIDGKSVVGYGSSAFRLEDKELVEEYNKHYKQ